MKYIDVKINEMIELLETVGSYYNEADGSDKIEATSYKISIIYHVSQKFKENFIEN